MINPDELEPAKTKVKPLDLGTLSIGELADYIKNLEAEIARARDFIAKKESHRSAIESMFKK
ncbi:MAG: DUF1192 domain-containing protein [Alphaproteobacteria bacterium]